MSLHTRLDQIEKKLMARIANGQSRCHCGKLWLEVSDVGGKVPDGIASCPQCRWPRGMVLVVDTYLVSPAL